jgi:hypothetical protein
MGARCRKRGERLEKAKVGKYILAAFAGAGAPSSERFTPA